MKYGMTKIRNFSKVNYDSASTFVKHNWIKLILILFALFIILKKDISLNFNLQAAGSAAQTSSSYYEPVAHQVSYSEAPTTRNVVEQKIISAKNKIVTKTEKVTTKPLPYFEPEESLITPPSHKKSKPKTKGKDNRANTFANLTFIMSPTYAARKNIPKEVVDEKKQTVYNYVKRYADIAVTEMKFYNIPASITLAQGLLESDAGESRLARNNNNHFGIKCFSRKCHKGHCANFTDDTHKDFFRKYKNVWDSYRAHSVFLQGKRYKHLQKLGTTDYKNWAYGLRKAGYATDKRYAEKLIRIIETLELDKYDV